MSPLLLFNRISSLPNMVIKIETQIFFRLPRAQRTCWRVLVLHLLSQYQVQEHYSYYRYYIKSAVFGEENYAYGGHEDYVRGIEFFEVPNLGEQSTDISKEICSSITNCRLVSVSDDSSIIQWSVVSGEVLCRIPKAHDEMIMASALVPVSCGGTSLLCTGSEDGSARLWCLPLSV
eukprot:Tbor_TRINITY_DN5412_c0_g2::TRINITY_DN5412_c0_g2_i1::g.25008::m.25008